VVLKGRILFIFSIFCLAFFLVVSKAFYVQVINSEKLKNYAANQFFKEYKKYPKRGNILDRNGNPLAINVHRYSIFGIPKLMKDLDESVKSLGQAMKDRKAWKAYRKMLVNRNRFTWLHRKVQLTADQVSAIQKIDGIFLEEDNSRFYPNGNLMSQVLGFVGNDNKGLGGVEYSFNEELKGQAHVVKYFKDAKGRPVKFQANDHNNSAKNLILSLDKNIQGQVEEYLKEAVVFHEADSGGAAIMNAETGELLALANYPGFDPNRPQKYPVKNKKLSFITDPFEPGSVFKTFTVAAALENGVARKDSNYYCEKGKMRVGNHVISEAESHEQHEWLSVSDILKHSSNIGTTKIAFDLGFPRFKTFLEKLHFFEKSGVELPGESKGIFSLGDKVTPLSLSNMSFGQGVATTPMQILTAYAAIANGGYYVKPTILKKESSVIDQGTEPVIGKAIVDDLTEMLGNVVVEGTASNARMKHFRVAGKTSTAQRVSPQGGYDGYIAGFVGFPLHLEKKFVIYVYINNPQKNGYYGNKVAAPVFNKIAQTILYREKDFRIEDIAQLQKEKKDIVNYRASAVQRKSYARGQIPDFRGMDKKSALDLAESKELNLVHQGFGVVQRQKPDAGTKIENGDTVTLFYAPPAYE